MSDLNLDKIELQLEQLNTNLAEANDIAILTAYSSMPADLDNDSRKALGRLRDRMMERVQERAKVL